MSNPSIAKVLAEIAETASETLELQEVFNRVATSVRLLIPFKNMGVVRILDGKSAVVHAATFDCEHAEGACTEPRPLVAWSPAIRPQAVLSIRIDDAGTEFDPTFEMDREIAGAGVRSILWEPFRSRSSFTGGVWLCADEPRAFGAAHQEI